MSQLSDKNRIVRLDADDHPNPLHSDSLKSTVSTLQSDVTVEFDPPSAVHQSPAFHSTIYRSLAEPCSPLEDKVRAGYKLIDGQRRDIARMMNKVSDLRAAHEGKQSAIEQLYVMVEQVQPLLTQLSGWSEKVMTEEAELMGKLKAAKALSGIPEEDFDV